MFYFPYTTVGIGQATTAWNALSSSIIESQNLESYTATFGDGTSATIGADIGAVFVKTYSSPGTYVWTISASTSASTVSSINQIVEVQEKFNEYFLDSDTRHISDILKLPNDFQKTKVITNASVRSADINYTLNKLQENNEYLENQLRLFDNNAVTTLKAWYGYTSGDSFERPFWHTNFTTTFNSSSASQTGYINNIQDILVKRNPLGVQLVYMIADNKVQARVDNNWADALFSTNSLQRGLTIAAPVAIRIGDKETIYILDRDGNCIHKVKYDPTTKTFIGLDRFGNFGLGENQLSAPLDMDVIGTKIAVGDTGNARIMVLDSGFKIMATIHHSDWIADPVVSVKIHPISKNIWILTRKGIIYIADASNTITQIHQNVNPFGVYVDMCFAPAGDIVYTLAKNSLHKAVTDRSGMQYEYLKSLVTKTTEDFISVNIDDSRRILIGTNTKILAYTDFINFIQANKEVTTFWTPSDYEIAPDAVLLSWVYQNSLFKIAENLNNLISITDRRIVRFLDFNGNTLKYDALNYVPSDEMDYLTDDLNIGPNLNEPVSSLVVNRGVEIILNKQLEYLEFLKTKNIYQATPAVPHIVL